MTVKISMICQLNKELMWNEPCSLSKSYFFSSPFSLEFHHESQGPFVGMQNLHKQKANKDFRVYSGNNALVKGRICAGNTSD